MAERGPYAKGRAKREDIIDAALLMIAREGYSKTTIPSLAAEVGLSTTGLIHHFGTKDKLFAAILERRNARDEAFLNDRTSSGETPVDLGQAFGELIRLGGEKKGLTELGVHYTAESADPAHPSHEFFRAHFERARSLAAEGIRAEKASGHLEADVDPEILSVLLFAMLDGLELHAMFAPDIDRGAAIEYFWRAATGKL